MGAPGGRGLGGICPGTGEGRPDGWFCATTPSVCPGAGEGLLVVGAAWGGLVVGED